MSSTSKRVLPTPSTRDQKWTRHGAFANVDEMKERVRRSLTLTEELSSCRTMSYKEDGLLSRIVQSKRFENLSVGVVMLNAAWIAIDSDHNDAIVLTEANPLFQVAEHMFCTYFVMELALRFFSLKHAQNGFYDTWFRFDLFLVCMMVVETWVVTIVVSLINGISRENLSMISVLRVLRLTRLTRLSRLMRAVPELLFMMKGMLEAVRSVLWTLVLLIVLLYFFGIIMKQLSTDTSFGKKWFYSVPASMYTLLLDGTFMDGAGGVLDAIRKESITCTIIFMVFIVLAALTTMNMLVGVLCEVVSAVAATEREELSVAYVKDQVRFILRELDEDHDGLISKDEFKHIVEHPDAVAALDSVGVDVLALVSYADFIFQSDKHGMEFNKRLDFHDFMDIVLKLRGDQQATVRDIVELRKFIHSENTQKSLDIAKMAETDLIMEKNQRRMYRDLNRDLTGLRKTFHKTMTGSLSNMDSNDLK